MPFCYIFRNKKYISTMINLISSINELLWNWPFIILLVVTSLYLTIKLKFPQKDIIISFKDIFKGQKKDTKNKITSFRTLMTVLAGALGTGNITGVATSILVGGVGSIFWLFISGILAMAISYAENYIVLRFRKKDSKKGYYGGTMYVLDEVLDKKKLAIFFAIAVAISAVCTGTMTQSNSLSTLLNTTVSIDKRLVGGILAIITAYIIFGGKQRLAKASSIVIPVCTIIYILLCITIICINRQNILPGIKYILKSAFGIKEVVGGIVGFSFSKMIGKGFALGMFSNEAGMGSSPIFTATVDEEDIHKQASIAATSVVIDTIILCVLTGITIVSTGLYNIPNVSDMLKAVFGTIQYGHIILNICMVFFVIATIPCWEYYGEEATRYIFKSNMAIYIFRIMYIIGIYIGSIVAVRVVWDMSGITNALMTLPNLYMIYSCLNLKNIKYLYNNKRL